MLIFFWSTQILTNVLRIPVLVIRTLTVPTVTDLTAAHVNWASLEMGQIAKVFPRVESRKILLQVFFFFFF